MAAARPEPSPVLFFDTVNAFQRTAALKAAIELALFTAIGEGNQTPPAIAQRCQASERGCRILCDYLTVLGFLQKSADRYTLTPDSALFLDRRSPAYAGSAIEFLLSTTLTGAFEGLADAVRKGSTVLPGEGSMAPEHPMWVRFARGMAPLMALPAEKMAQLVSLRTDRPATVLDIAAGHGLYGIAFARRNPNVTVVALDWPNVLEVARENAERAGVGDRYRTLPGNAFDVELGRGYDLILLTNFLHHADPPTCEGLLRRVHAALADGGRAVTLEFVPNDDRVSPPLAAMFSLTMLATTAAGDAYTFRELEQMFKNAGFQRSELHSLPPTPHAVVVSEK